MAFNETGDEYAKAFGQRAWISEMYGYSFGASTAGVWHRADHAAMLYPGYAPTGARVGAGGGHRARLRCFPEHSAQTASRPGARHRRAPASLTHPPRADKPLVLHYGRMFEIGPYRWQKHWLLHFDAVQVRCRRRQRGSSGAGGRHRRCSQPAAHAHLAPAPPLRSARPGPTWPGPWTARRRPSGSAEACSRTRRRPPRLLPRQGLACCGSGAACLHVPALAAASAWPQRLSASASPPVTPPAAAARRALQAAALHLRHCHGVKRWRVKGVKRRGSRQRILQRCRA